MNQTKPLSKQIGKYNCLVFSTNTPSTESIERTNQKINSLMDKKRRL